MQTARNKSLLFNWIFLSGLVLLAFNDHYLKAAYPNWVTGKLSDFSGLLILPMLLLFLFPRLSNLVFVVSGLFFIYWKLPLSESFIDHYNRVALIPIVRTVDYTDLIALLILPVSYALIKNIGRYTITDAANRSLHPLFILIPCSAVFMATSPPISYYMRPGGDIHIGKSYKMKMSKDKILERLRAEGFTVKPDSLSKAVFPRGEHYLVENIILSGGKDTIRSIQFGFIGNNENPVLLVNNITLQGQAKLSDWRTLKRFSKYYRKIIDDKVIDELR